jgi:hypothetical protein
MTHLGKSDQNNQWLWNKTGLDGQFILRMLRAAIIGVLLMVLILLAGAALAQTEFRVLDIHLRTVLLGENEHDRRNI